jgi:hypothetical protein
VFSHLLPYYRSLKQVIFNERTCNGKRVYAKERCKFVRICPMMQNFFYRIALVVQLARVANAEREQNSSKITMHRLLSGITIW